ncbi:Polyisoprenoid-binding protein YceI [Amycolatopsis marina]|uniref:Polyisoprenoid-binding protein YceI n=1 Tax=Amycolatopsis marina TaxID=490629 RepID=A0A1I1ASC6_9PSEU|nr:YceI family protein [Amycolatopsis marina]SFB40931.1 Polyisoprenoid-binding protein YceI [Amycolatopsis marina]
MTSPTADADLTGTYDLDPAHSRMGFVARHAMVTKVRGAFTEFDGQLHIDGQDPAKSSGQLTITATSIDTGVQQRDEHLRSNDFFDMPNYPEITFTSTAVERVGGDSYRVTGDLTIKDTTKPVTLDVEYTGSALDPMGNNRIGLEATTTVSRKEWGITWNAPLETGGVLVSDKIVLDIDISAIKHTDG